MQNRPSSLLPICLLACLTTSAAQAQTTTDAQREALVIQARQGHWKHPLTVYSHFITKHAMCVFGLIW
ncbi:hypothetical protein HORIV_29770 [Vreelandella olivaria]|uniref:Uncharacterized protein n=1 Tax=Vreelandella olivaria TaxID=390919 RepID=A0ABN5WUC0_9GAMM|nr:hypothetical protein HORIV_29770 [Halomonas olivaria]